MCKILERSGDTVWTPRTRFFSTVSAPPRQRYRHFSCPPLRYPTLDRQKLSDSLTQTAHDVRTTTSSSTSSTAARHRSRLTFTITDSFPLTEVSHQRQPGRATRPQTLIRPLPYGKVSRPLPARRKLSGLRSGILSRPAFRSPSDSWASIGVDVQDRGRARSTVRLDDR